MLQRRLRSGGAEGQRGHVRKDGVHLGIDLQGYMDENRFSGVVSVAAISLSALAAGAVLSVGATSTKQLSEARRAAAHVPQLGALRGWLAQSDLEWVPGEKSTVVLFGVTESGVGDAGFWRAVAHRGHVMGLDALFVGLCVSKESCSLTSSENQRLVLLSAMDPAQSRAVITATKQGRAFLFINSNLRGFVEINSDIEAFAGEISKLTTQSVAADDA